MSDEAALETKVKGASNLWMFELTAGRWGGVALLYRSETVRYAVLRFLEAESDP